MSSASTIIGYIEGITKVDTSSIGLAGIEQTMMLNVIDKANREYYLKFMLGGGEPRSDRTAETGGTIVSATVLGEDVTSATTDFDVSDSTGFFSSGALAIWEDEEPDFLAYTGNAANNLTGVTGIGYPHSEGDQVSQLYPLPANFESFRSTADAWDGVKVDGIPYTFTTGTPTGSRFAIYDDGTTKYLVFPLGLTGEYSIKYNKGATSITSASTAIDVPIEDEDFVVYRGVEHVYRVLNVDPNKAAEARQMANKIMLDALKRRNVGKRLRSGRPFMMGGRTSYPESELINHFIA